MKFIPNCSKRNCRRAGNVLLRLVGFGPVFYCAGHALQFMKLGDK